MFNVNVYVGANGTCERKLNSQSNVNIARITKEVAIQEIFVVVGLDPSSGDRQGAGWSTATILEGHTNSLSQSSLVRRSTFITGVAISILL